MPHQSEIFQIISQTIPQTPFQWRLWDCFTLMNWTRHTIGLPTINADHIYQQFPTHASFPPRALHNIAPSIAHPQSSTPQNGDILIIDVGETLTLGTLLILTQNEQWATVINDRPHFIPVSRIPNLHCVTIWTI
jgi:hypothetical protein